MIMIAIGHASTLEPPRNSIPCSASIGPGNRSRRCSLFPSRAAVRVSGALPESVEGERIGEETQKHGPHLSVFKCD